MAYLRTKIGNILKGKDGKPDYIKIESDVTLKKGDYLNLENQKSQLESLNNNREKMSDEVFQKATERIESIPTFIRFEIIKITKD